MGNASADDIEQLIYLAQKIIRDLNDIDLQIEVKIIGDKSE
jgi:UDP-N-acetylenolpyruvoylglucosamine reductase